ncbi:transglutaminaseTgpA domain-containing protein [Cnuibacter sp. UC19_7]|uniref:transglutaminase family protein n=1 Tax=Cnuibacter sp. UC19_7 TaxID=3350166 RepID=UPI00366B613A
MTALGTRPDTTRPPVVAARVGGSSGGRSRRWADRRRDHAGAWLSTLFVAVGVGVALFGLSPLLQGIGWWFSTMAMVVLVLAVSAVLRAVGASELAAVVLSAVVWAVVVVALYAASTLWIVFPTLSTLSELSADLAAARESIAVQAVPAVADEPITQLLVMSIGLIAIVTDALATGLRKPALSGVGLLAVLAIAPFIREPSPQVGIYLLVGLAYLGIIWTSSRIGGTAVRRREPRAGRNPLLAVVIAGATVLATAVLPVITPGLTESSLDKDQAGNLFPSVYSAGIDPTIQLGRDLRRSTPVLSLTYSTTGESAEYLRMVTLGDFTEGAWHPEEGDDLVPYAAQQIGTPAGLAPDVPTQSERTEVSISALRTDWLPMPFPATQVEGLPTGQWQLSSGLSTLTASEFDTRGLTYAVSSVDVQPTPEQFAAAGSSVPADLDRYLQLPDVLPAIIGDTARSVTASAATNYDRAVALQEYFRSSLFTYSLSSPVAGGYDGDSADMIAAFLEAKSGYCVHYASAMAVMARVLGIPARIAIGYAPSQTANGTRDGVTTYDVYTDQLHSWPELFFEGIGWVPFEPTPGLDFTPPDYSLPDYATSGTGDSAAVDRDPATLPQATQTARGQDDVGGGTTAAAVSAAETARGWITAGLITLAVVVVVLTPFAVRTLIRRRRFTALRGSPHPATIAWMELEDSLDDERFSRSPTETVQSLAERLIADRRVPADRVRRLAASVEREQFAAPGRIDADSRTVIASDLEAVLKSLADDATASERALARLVPLSLWRRARSSTTARAEVAERSRQ